MPTVLDNIADLLEAVRSHLQTRLEAIQTTDFNRVLIGNIAQPDNEGFNGSGTESLTDRVVLTLVRTEEDLRTRNRRGSRPNPLATSAADASLTANLPVLLTLHLLVTANHANYATALRILSNVIAVFQQQSFVPLGTDRKLSFSLLSPSLEDHNNLWSNLGGKQLPAVLYQVQQAQIELIPDEPLTGPAIVDITLTESLS